MKEFKTTENLEEKIKVTSLEIIVTGTKDKPYFEIKYKELGKEDYNIGYSSYDLNNVFTWKNECFEIVNELAEEYKVSEIPTGWIPCSKELPPIPKQTNADRIRSMTDEELAKYISELIRNSHEYMTGEGDWLIWLRSEAE